MLLRSWCLLLVTSCVVAALEPSECLGKFILSQLPGCDHTVTSTLTVVGIVCERVVKAAKELGAKQNITPSLALEKYCGIPSIEVEDEQFCYNVATLKKDVNRLLDLGADASRVCKKVKAVNSDFCKTKVVKIERTGIQLNERFKKGIIYE
jgi:hypothetical protein